MERAVFILLACLFAVNIISSKNFKVHLNDNIEGHVYSYMEVDKLPKLNDSVNILDYMNKNIYHRQPTDIDCLSTILVSFIIKKDGSVGNVFILKGACETCNGDIIKVLKSTPKWIPGQKNSKNVNVMLFLPIDHAIKQQ